MAASLEGYWLLTVEWVRGNMLELAIATTAAVFLFLALSWLRRFAFRVAQKSERRAAMKSIVARTLARTSKFFRVMVAVQLVNSFANAPAPIARTITVFFTISFVIQVAIWLREIILGLIERRAGEGEHEHETLANAMVLIRLLVSFALFAIAAIVILDNLGVNVTGLVAGLGVGGIAIGLAAQGIFSDLFAAMSIIFDKPFRRGDVIAYDTTIATVEKIGMKSTRLRSISGEERIIANRILLEKEIVNHSLTAFRRVTFILNLVYQLTTEKALRVPDMLREIVDANGGEFVRAGFINFGPSSLDFELVFDVASPELEDMVRARHQTGIAIIQRFAAEGFEFAYPTQTTFTAAPDGTLVMPYAPPKPATTK